LRGPHSRRVGPAILRLFVSYNIGRGRLVPVPLERSPRPDSADDPERRKAAIKIIDAPTVIRVQRTSRQHDETATKTRRHCCVN